MADYQLFIDGEYVDAASGETFTDLRPRHRRKIAEVAKAGREDAVRAIEAARKAFDEGPWPKMSGAERAAKLNKIAELIEANAEKFAEMPRPATAAAPSRRPPSPTSPAPPAPSAGSPAGRRAARRRSS